MLSIRISSTSADAFLGSDYYQYYVKALQLETGRLRAPELFDAIRSSQKKLREATGESLNMGLLYYLYDLERLNYVFETNHLHINYEINQAKLNAHLLNGRCVYARNVVGVMFANRRGVRHHKATQTVYLDVWNDAANELNRERLRNVRRVVVDSPREDFPYDWAVSALLEAIETEDLRIELEIPRPERLSENTKRVLREKGRL